MPKADFAEYVVKDLLTEVRGVTSRAMFGGFGLYKDGFIFGIIVDDEVYFKVGDRNRKKYEEAESRPFTYKNARGKVIAMSYWEIPADVLEDREAVARWVEESCQISRSSSTKPSVKRYKKSR
ncbi:MAG: TfoX/Sxy family protein [Candidatus Omnitrophota bacterium]